MPITNSSLAAAKGAGVQLSQFTPSANDIPRNIVIVGTFNPSLAGSITAETVYGPYSNAGQVAAVFGAGYMIHRLAVAVFTGAPTGGVTVYVIPQAEVAGASATSSTFAITGPATAAGTLSVYVANIKYQVAVASGDTAIVIAGNIAAAITADTANPCSAANSGTANCTLTAKSKGPWGNSIPVAVNIQAGDSLPAGVGCTVTALTSGTGVPTIANALNNGLGTGSNANTLPGGQWMTALVHGYLATGTVMATTAQDQTTTTAVSVYNGIASAATGCYDHTVGRPFTCLLGDATNSASVPSALTTYATTNNNDRTNMLLCIGGTRTHPCEAAAVATAVMEVRSGTTAHRPFVDMALPGVEGGPASQWNLDWNNRNTGVSGGLSPCAVSGGTVYLQNVVTFYTANTGVPAANNGYRERVNIVKLQNIIASLLSNFKGPKWQGFTIVKDSTLVTDPYAKQYVRSVTDLNADLIALGDAWAGKAWIYSADPIINAIRAGTAVSLRPAGDGFTISLPGVLSGVGNIIDATFNFDISLAGQ